MFQLLSHGRKCGYESLLILSWEYFDKKLFSQIEFSGEEYITNGTTNPVCLLILAHVLIVK